MGNLDSILPIIVWVVIILVGIFSSKKKPEQAPKIEKGKKPQDFAGMLQYLERLNRGEGYSQEGASKEVAKKTPKTSEQTNRKIQNQEAKALEKKKKKVEEAKTHIEGLSSIKSTKPPKPEKPKKVEKGAEEDEDYRAYHQRERVNAVKKLFEDKDQVRNAFIMSEIMKRKYE